MALFLFSATCPTTKMGNTSPSLSSLHLIMISSAVSSQLSPALKGIRLGRCFPSSVSQDLAEGVVHDKWEISVYLDRWMDVIEAQ